MWNAFVELIRVTIFSAAHVCGGSLGAGILAVSLAMRLALMPLTLRIARQARVQAERLAALKPEIERLQRRYAKDRARLMRETQALYTANGIRFLTPTGLVGLLVQMPLLGALFSAVRAGLGARVRFLWIGNLALPDALLIGLVAALGAGSMLLAPRPQGAAAAHTATMMLVGGGLMVFFLWSASSAVALSFGAGSVVSALQSWILAREARHAAPAA